MTINSQQRKAHASDGLGDVCWDVGGVGEACKLWALSAVLLIRWRLDPYPDTITFVLLHADSDRFVVDRARDINDHFARHVGVCALENFAAVVATQTAILCTFALCFGTVFFCARTCGGCACIVTFA